MAREIPVDPHEGFEIKRHECACAACTGDELALDAFCWCPGCVKLPRVEVSARPEPVHAMFCNECDPDETRGLALAVYEWSHPILWTQRDRTIWTAEAALPDGHTLALRVDGRDGPFRVDMSLGFGMWEAIDKGVGYVTEIDARDFAEEYAGQLRGERMP